MSPCASPECMHNGSIVKAQGSSDLYILSTHTFNIYICNSEQVRVTCQPMSCMPSQA